MAKAQLARYEQIAAYLRSLVADAEPGDRLPSEAELCDRFDVSRMTARHAIAVLENESLVYRRRGRGTFVAPRRVPRQLGSPLSFTESTRRRGRTATSRIVQFEETSPSDADVKALGISADDQVLVLERVRLADGVPMALELAVIHPVVGRKLGTIADDVSLHDAFEQLDHVPTEAHAKVSARTVTPYEARHLEIPRTGVVLCERRTIHDQNGLALEHTETRYAAARYEFDVVLYRDQSQLLE